MVRAIVGANWGDEGVGFSSLKQLNGADCFAVVQ